MPESTTPVAGVESDTPKGPLSDRELGSQFMQALFGAPAEADTETDAPETDTEAGVTAEDEVEPEEVEASAETEPEAEETQEPETTDETPQPRKLRVKIADDVEEEVTEEELVKGYQRQSDYTRKTQALAEERKRFESEELAKVREERQKYAAYLAQLEEALKPVAPDWDKIKAENPDGFPHLYAEYQIQERNHAIAKAEREKAEAQVQRDHADARAKLLQAEATKLVEKVPELKEPTTAKALGDYLLELGFTPEEIAGTARHELLVMAHKARLYDEAKKVKPKIQEKVEQKIKPAKPGVPNSTKPKTTELERDVNRLRKTGDVRDLGRVLSKIL
jgi:hypothetical protein